MNNAKIVSFPKFWDLWLQHFEMIKILLVGLLLIYVISMVGEEK